MSNLLVVLVIGKLEFKICFVIRVSYFGFIPLNRINRLIWMLLREKFYHLLFQRHPRHRHKQHPGNQFGGVIIPVFNDQGEILV